MLQRFARSDLTEEVVRRYETDLLCEANGLGFYDGRLSTLISLQHHGGATRLLDITRNLYVALWFACEPTATDSDGVVFHFQLAPDRVFYHYELDTLDNLIGDELRGRTIAYFPRATNERIKAQQAGFLTTVLNGCLPPDTAFPESEDVTLERIVIPASIKTEFRQYLWTHVGMNALAIYPDFAGSALANRGDAPFTREDQNLYDAARGLFPNRRL